MKKRKTAKKTEAEGAAYGVKGETLVALTSNKAGLISEQIKCKNCDQNI